MRAKLAVALAAAALICVACQTLYTSTVTITEVVDVAMRNWADASVAGKTTVDIDKKVVIAHDKYRAACGVAQSALIAYKTTGNQAEYVKALIAVRAAVDGLFQIILPLLPQQEAWKLEAQFQKATKL